MKQEKWTQQLRNKLADHEETVPADLWAGIEAKLAQQAAPEPRPRIIPLWGRWAAAAAAFIACMVLGAGYWMQQTDQVDMIAEAGTETKIKSVAHEPSSETTQAIAEKAEQGLMAQFKRVKSVVDAITSTESAQAEQLVAYTKPVEQVSEEQAPAAQDVSDISEERPSAQASETKPSEKKPSLKQTLEDNEEAIRQLDEKIAEETKRSSSRASFGLYAANGFGNQMSANGVFMNPTMAANYNQNNYLAGTRSESTNLISLAGYEEQQEHYQPISFGLTTNISISPKVSIVTGLVYTRLRSDFTRVMPGGSVKTEQTLHYLGIPVSVQYQLWDYKGLKMYAAAGGQIDYNIKTKMETAGVDVELERDRLQFSAQGALGLQYNFVPMVGIYVEPGLRYYFDNGSDIRNFFKDKPTNFNLQIGFRLNLSNN